MSNIVGIDLGTTYSAIAVLDSVGKPEIVANAEGDHLTPSVVFFSSDENGKVLVGSDARVAMAAQPSRGAEETKRQMGEDHLLTVDSEPYSPTQISSFILKKLVQDASKTKGNISSVIVTVPANFEESARNATIDAGKLAGIEVELINEPTAAALFFATQQPLNGNLLVYDLGGGTFDATIAKISDQEVECLASKGDRSLGGKDFDRMIFDKIRDAYSKQHGVEIVDEHHSESEFMEQAEGLKRQLSRRDVARGVFKGPAGPLTFSISKQDFEEMISASVARTEMLVEVALDEASLSPTDIDFVLMVGGSTRIPAFHDSVTNLFKKEPLKTVNPDEAVALGAAIYAGKKAPASNLSVSQQKAMSAVKLQEVCGSYFGTIAVRESSSGADESYNSIIIKKNTPIPCSEKSTYYTTAAGQRMVDCSVTQCNAEEEDPEFTTIVWKGKLELPPDRPSHQPVEITYRYDENETMHAAFKDMESGKILEIDLHPERSKRVELEKTSVEDFVVE